MKLMAIVLVETEWLYPEANGYSTSGDRKAIDEANGYSTSGDRKALP